MAQTAVVPQDNGRLTAAAAMLWRPVLNGRLGAAMRLIVWLFGACAFLLGGYGWYVQHGMLRVEQLSEWKAETAARLIENERTHDSINATLADIRAEQRAQREVLLAISRDVSSVAAAARRQHREEPAQ